ncbi:MAG: stage III sporulation protein AA [Lachnospiraceae bacterium]|nr:stage III sporulation protein AA [Lachnospiraceae bacterium]
MKLIGRLLAEPLSCMLEESGLDFEGLQEIRLRVGQPVIVVFRGREWTLCRSGKPSREISAGYRISGDDLNRTLEVLSGYSLYAFDEEVRQGFFTIPGGHRVGLAGHAEMDERGVRCIRFISFLNIRLSHQRKGCADALMPFLYQDGEVCHTLIVSPPGGGKTTLLRDIIRQISDGGPLGAGRTVGVVDERSELAGAYLGVPQNDLGMRTDVMDGCTKAEGMMMLLRSMSPHVIAVDELGGSRDGDALENVFHCGCRLIATVHGASVDELEKKPLLQSLQRAQRFDRYVVLGGRDAPGRIREIRGSLGELLCARC